MDTGWRYVNEALLKFLKGDNCFQLLTSPAEALRTLFDVYNRNEFRPEAIQSAATPIVLFMMRPNFLGDWLDRAGKGNGRRAKEFAPYITEELNDFQPILPLLVRIAGHSREATIHAWATLFEKGFLEGALIDCPTAVLESFNCGDCTLSFRRPGGDILLIPLARFAQDPTLASFKSLWRPCAKRDHLWLSWKKDAGLKPAQIRDRWNKLDENKRMNLSPISSKKLLKVKLETVKRGLRVAGEEDAELGKAFERRRQWHAIDA